MALLSPYLFINKNRLSAKLIVFLVYFIARNIFPGIPKQKSLWPEEFNTIWPLASCPAEQKTEPLIIKEEKAL